MIIPTAHLIPLYVFAFLVFSVTSLPQLASENKDSCHKNVTGILAAHVNGKLKPFTVIDPLGSISWNEQENHPLKIEFQLCDSLVNAATVHTEISGRIYVPEYKQCIDVSNQPDPQDPYFTMLKTCDTSYAQRFLIRTNENYAVYWTGSSDPEGTILQGGCGLLYYESEKNGTPVVTENGVPISCNGTAFRIIRD